MKLHGIFPAMVTPATQDGMDIDIDAAAKFANSLIERGVHGLFALGSTGEAPLLTREQRRRLLETVVAAAGGRVPVVGGVGSPSTAQSMAFAQDAAAAGCDAISILPLHFIRLGSDELYGYFAAIADCVSIPTILYNFPALTSSQNIPADVAARLAGSHNVIGIKDSGGNLTNTLGYLAACGKDFATMTGDESQMHALIACGGHGSVCAAANVFPELLVALYSASTARDTKQAAMILDRVLRINRCFSHGTFPSAIKSAVNWSGINIGPPFKPVNALSEAQMAEQNAELTRLTQLIER